jgi:hypothetical protein
MKKIPRIYDNLKAYLKPNKVLLIYGPRRVGKTTILNDFLKKTKLKYRLDSGDNIKIQQVLSSSNFDLIQDYVADNQLIAIDEAQKIPNIGENLKIIVDQFPKIKVIATGSSSFELAGQVGEPLTGRKNTLTLFPVSQMEYVKLYSRFDLKNKLDEWLIYGSYPDILTTNDKNQKVQILTELVESYLLKDILAFDMVKNSKTVFDLLRLLAFQIGQEVSLTELSQKLGIDYKTVARYLDLLEKSFIICRLSGYSRNLRKEITQKNKYYFWDNGVRNALISSFNSVDLRDDVGKLWENFLFIERLKKKSYKNIYGNNYFWRTWEQHEIDLIEERDGKLFGFEFKLGKTKSTSAKFFLETYKESEFTVIDKSNYLDFIL